MSETANDVANLQDILYEADQLIKKAIKIVSGAPFWTYCSEKEWAYLVIDGDVATLFWPETSSYYDSCSIETESKEFPADLLLMGDDEIEKWKVEQEAIYKAEQERKNLAADAQQRVQNEANERAMLAALKAKYEHP